MPNRLAGESSPYLLQHASNPVDWRPWGEQALRAAREEGRPILLSVGYSACHWCHVMAHESFEDPAVAALMNELFVCVKVDREERPDIDSVYMQAVQLMTGQGGWPLTVFLTPEAVPYFGGTYFPPVQRHGMPGFPAVLRAAHAAYRQHRDDVERAGVEIVRGLATPPLAPGVEPVAATVAAAVERLVEQVDLRRGGFGGAPKFPHPSALELLLRGAVDGRDSPAARAVRISLHSMARGGIFDQLAGGFHRYSVDADWLVPHFEKMLYDNAQMALLYLHAFQQSGQVIERRVAEATLDYLMREMRLPGGAFASSQDADSDGEEGAFFLWTPAQLSEALGDEADARLAGAVFGVGEAGSFAGERSVLRLAEEPVTAARKLGLPAGDLEERLGSIRSRLLAVRSRRIAPGRDGKVVTAWNGLALRAFAEAGCALGRPDYVEVARSCARFLLSELVVDGRLRRTWRDGVTGASAFLDDVAALGDGLLAVYEATGDPGLFAAAVALGEEAVERFRDQDGAYFDTPSDAEPLPVRPHGLDDGPVPAGQSLAAQLFVRLAALTGEDRWRQAALEIVTPLTAAIARVPLALSALGCVAEQLVAPSREVAVVGPSSDPATAALLTEVWRRRDPHRVVAWGPAAGVPLLAGRPLVDGLPTAYVCEGFSCMAPTTDPAELAAQLSAGA